MIPAECVHNNVLTMRLIGDQYHYGNQCQTCGEWGGAVIQNPDNLDERRRAIPWDKDLARKWFESLWGPHVVTLTKDKTESDNQRQSDNSYDSYDEYLKSDAWRHKRNLALSRDNRICQGCMAAPAVHVHHTIYPPAEMRGHEPLYWLVSLCGPCHKQIHTMMDKRPLAKAWF